jgi:hypothetical protein
MLVSANGRSSLSSTTSIKLSWTKRCWSYLSLSSYGGVVCMYTEWWVRIRGGVKDQEPKGNIQGPKIGERSDCPSSGGEHTSSERHSLFLWRVSKDLNLCIFGRKWLERSWRQLLCSLSGFIPWVIHWLRGLSPDLFARPNESASGLNTEPVSTILALEIFINGSDGDSEPSGE